MINLHVGFMKRHLCKFPPGCHLQVSKRLVKDHVEGHRFHAVIFVLNPLPMPYGGPLCANTGKRKWLPYDRSTVIDCHSDNMIGSLTPFWCAESA